MKISSKLFLLISLISAGKIQSMDDHKENETYAGFKLVEEFEIGLPNSCPCGKKEVLTSDELNNHLHKKYGIPKQDLPTPGWYKVNQDNEILTNFLQAIRISDDKYIKTEFFDSEFYYVIVRKFFGRATHEGWKDLLRSVRIYAFKKKQNRCERIAQDIKDFFDCITH